MILLKRNNTPGNRYALIVTRRGVETAHQRTQVGGGWYTRDSVTFPWPRVSLNPKPTKAQIRASEEFDAWWDSRMVSVNTEKDCD